MKIREVSQHLAEEMKDPHFKELYELEQQKLTVIKPIVTYRVKHQLTQGDLAKQVGVSQQHISKIENGEFSSMSTLQKVLLHIGYTVKIQAVSLDVKVRNRIKKALAVR